MVRNKSFKKREDDTDYLLRMKELPTSKIEMGEKSFQTTTFGNKERQGEISKFEKKEEIFSEDSFWQEEEEQRFPLSRRDILLGLVNFVFLILTLFILYNFPAKAEELRKKKEEEYMVWKSMQIDSLEIERGKGKAKEMENLFLDEAGIADFVNKISSIATVSFASPKPIKDRSGNLGIPIILEFSGSWEEIDSVLRKIDSLPFLFRVIKIEAEKKEDSLIKFKYGIILYVSDKLGENR